MARVTITVSDDVLATWRDAAKVQGSSLSGVISHWMTELQPGLRDIVRLQAAWVAADAEQREVMRAAVTSTGDQAHQAMLASWDTLTSTFETDHVQ